MDEADNAAKNRGHEENSEARVSMIRADGWDSPHAVASLSQGKKRPVRD